MTKEIGIFFQDPSEREDGYKVEIDDVNVGKITIDANNQQFVQEGEVELKTSNTPSPDSVGEDYQININNNDKGTKKVTIINFNSSGETKKQIGYADVYRRSNLYLYIGDEQVLGESNVSELSLYEGQSAETLEQIIDQCQIKTIYKSGTMVEGSWKDMQASNYAKDNKFGAELSMADGLRNSLNKPIAVWRLSIPSAIASTSYASGADGLTYIQNNINAHIQELRDNFVQGRLSGVIINMENRDTNMITAYQDLIDWLRSYFDFPDLPIVIVDRKGTEDLVSDDDDVMFEIQDKGDRIGSYYRERGLLGFYSSAKHLSGFDRLEWRKVFESNGNPVNGAQYIQWGYSPYGLSVNLNGAYAEYVPNHGFMYHKAVTGLTNRQLYFDIAKYSLHHVYYGFPLPFYIKEKGSSCKTVPQWKDYFKFNTYEEMFLWAQNYNLDLNAIWANPTNSNSAYNLVRINKYADFDLYENSGETMASRAPLNSYNFWLKDQDIVSGGDTTLELQLYNHGGINEYTTSIIGYNVNTGSSTSIELYGYYPSLKPYGNNLGKPNNSYDNGLLGSQKATFIDAHYGTPNGYSDTIAPYSNPKLPLSQYLPFVTSGVGLVFFKKRGFAIYDETFSFMQELETNNKNVCITTAHHLEKVQNMLTAKSSIELGYNIASCLTPSIYTQGGDIEELAPINHLDATKHTPMPVNNDTFVKPAEYIEKGFDSYDRLTGGLIKMPRGYPTDFSNPQYIADDYRKAGMTLSGTPTYPVSRQVFTHSANFINGKPAYMIDKELYGWHTSLTSAFRTGFFNTTTFQNTNAGFTEIYRAKRCTIFVVARPTEVLRGSFIFQKNPRFLIHLPWDNYRGYFDINNLDQRNSRISFSFPLQVPIVCVFSYDNHKRESFVKVNGILAKKNTNTPAGSGLNSTDPVFLNGYYNQNAGIAHFNNPMALGELFFTTQEVTVDSVSKYEQSLMEKWNIN